MNEDADARPPNDAWRQAARRWSPLSFGGRIGRAEFVACTTWAGAGCGCCWRSCRW